MEVGFACGISAASVATAHQTVATDKTGKHSPKKGINGRHYAIDPAAGDATHDLQRTAYKGPGCDYCLHLLFIFVEPVWVTEFANSTRSTMRIT